MVVETAEVALDAPLAVPEAVSCAPSVIGATLGFDDVDGGAAPANDGMGGRRETVPARPAGGGVAAKTPGEGSEVIVGMFANRSPHEGHGEGVGSTYGDALGAAAAYLPTKDVVVTSVPSAEAVHVAVSMRPT
jgi:hypothetical protein